MLTSVLFWWYCRHYAANLNAIRRFRAAYVTDWSTASWTSDWFGLWSSFKLSDILLFSQKMSNPQLWYWRLKQANKTNVHHKPLATKTITSKSIYTASNYFNDSINNHFPQPRNTPLVLSILLLTEKREKMFWGCYSSRADKQTRTKDRKWCGILLLILESFLWWTSQLKGMDFCFQPGPIDEPGFLLVTVVWSIFQNLVWKWRKPRA